MLDHAYPGARASGEVTADDYRRILEPALRELVEGGQPIRLLYQLADDTDYAAGAALQDLKTEVVLGVPHLSAWRRTAVVSDAGWVKHMVGGFGWLMPGELRAFGTGRLQEAKAWLAK